MNKKYSNINLPDGALACFVVLQAQNLLKVNNNQQLVVIAKDQYQTQQLLKEIPLFLESGAQILVHTIPDYEVLPYERISPTHDIIVQRLKGLWALKQPIAQIVIISAAACTTAVVPLEYLFKNVSLLQKGQVLNLEHLIQQLLASGYDRVDQVYESGEFAIRGGIIDIIVGKNQGIRIELCDNEIESLAYFDPKTQVVKYYQDSIELIPPLEYPHDKAGLDDFTNCFQEYFPKVSNKTLQDYKQAIFPAGVESYLPLFFNGQKVSILNYLQPSAAFVIPDDFSQLLYAEWNVIKQQYARHENQYYCMKPNDLFHKPEDLLREIKQFNMFAIKYVGSNQNVYQDFAALPLIRADFKNMQSWQQIIDIQKKYQVQICSLSLGRSETLKQTFAKHGIVANSRLEFVVSPLQQGFIYHDNAYITEYNLYERIAKEYQYNKSREILRNDSSIRDLAELTVGDLVVHIDYGVGIYQGVTQENINDVIHELINIEYKDSAFVGVPIGHLYKISPYNLSDNAALDKLGSLKWQQIKKKTEKQVNDVAIFLLQLYADHATTAGIACGLPEGYRDFANDFPYPLTIDQANSINDVIIDLAKDKAMDRLICGDVGFGKTEVAMRAAYVVAANGYQVAVIVPTTVLASQHYASFVQRFSNTPLIIVELSRFKTAKEIKDNLELIKAGKADIVIATHRLLQQDVVFANLGLLVVDEEHRFGVTQKEKLRKLRNNGRHIHMLTMTATPIPRTLHMALEGIKDFSIIATPPQKRLSVNTIVAHDSNEVILDAIKREVRRGGQVFFLYNDVNSIVKMYHRLAELMPEIHIAIAHGQMPERDLETIIHDFSNGQYQLLLCSTIIENGIDIPQANTIIIYHADRLGLSQLYQLRGRVGRSAHQAYCYLVVPEAMSKDSQKRVDAIVNSQELGSGFNLAIHDLEIRGAGEILGDSQAGNIKNIGLSLYSDMLNKAIRQKQNESTLLETAIEINLGVNAIIPEDYCNDTNQRLVFYKRMTQCTTNQQLDQVYQEMVDLYGVAHEYVNNLLEVNRLRILAYKVGISKIKASDKIIIEFTKEHKMNPDKLIKLVTQHFSEGMSVSVDNKIIYNRELGNLSDKLKMIYYICNSLSEI